MGHVVNAVTNMAGGIVDVGKGLGQGVAAGACGILCKTDKMCEMVTNATANLDKGSKTCPIISEFRDVRSGIAEGDPIKIAANGGILLCSAVLLGGGSGPSSAKLAGPAGAEVFKAVALCVVNQALKVSLRHDNESFEDT